MGKKNKFKKEPDTPSSTSTSSGTQAAQPSTSQAATGQQPRPQQQQGPAGGQQSGQKQGGQAWGGQKQGGQGWGGQKPGGSQGPPSGQAQQSQQGSQGQRGPPSGQSQQGGQGQRGPQTGPGQQSSGQPWGGQSQGGQGQRGPPSGQAQQSQQGSQGQRGPPSGQAQQQQWRGQQGGQGQRGPQSGPGQQSSGQPWGGQSQGGQGQRGPPPGQSRGGPLSGQSQQPGQQQQYRDQPQGGRGRGQPAGRDRQSFGPQSQQQGGYGQRGGGDQRQAVRQQPQNCRSGDPVSCTGIKRGTLGQPGQVSVNYLDIDLSKMPKVAYHYDVKIDPDKPKKFLRPALEQFRVQFLGNSCVAYDGRNSCYSVDRLTHLNKAEEVEVTDSNGRTLHFKVEIKETENVQVELGSLTSYSKDRVFDKPMRALQCLEVALASGCHDMAVRAGRSFFKRPERTFDLGDGYEAWTGLYQAAILGDQPFLNVDISHKSFPKGMPIISYLEDYVANQRFNRDTKIDNFMLRNIQPFLKGITVVYKPPASFATAPRNFKVVDLSRQPASQLEFTMGEGAERKTMTVQQYYASRNYTLQYPQLLCLQVGNTIRSVYLPMELCEIQEGQALNKKDGSRQVQNMIKFAATSTNERKRKIMDLLQYFNHNQFDTVRRFGIQIGNNFIVVPTRILPSPRMEYMNNEFILPRNGSWQMGNRTSFLTTKGPLTGHKWAILHFKMPFNVINQLADMVKRQAQNLRILLDAKPCIEPFDNLDKIFMRMKSENYNLVFVILPNRGPSYADVKQKAELNYGILTQCIKQNTVERRLNPQLISNILLKVNSKLNGTNHKIEDKTHVPLNDVMYLGADVTHPSPDQKYIPSVVGVAASHDRFGANYNMQYRLQKGTDEIIVDMESIVTAHLRVYQEYQKSYPKHIIYYRDGVSDGQFPLVKNNELRGIKNACSKLKISPSLTCVIVVKRHHTRFFPDGEPQAPHNKFNNVTPGTVVDRVIVHPNEMQFFMVSHQSIQGTAKPTRYNVIENTAKLDVDLLQTLTYNLCHLFPRCNRVVSYPAPAYLAHLVAYRGRVYLEGTTRFTDPQSEYKRRLVNTNFMKSNPMYFV